MRRGVPCYEGRFFPVRINTHRENPVLALYGLAVMKYLFHKAEIELADLGEAEIYYNCKLQ
jgi:hypothetical protein